MSAGSPHGSRHPTVFRTLRHLPRASRALLIGTFINRMGTFLQVFLVLYLTHKGFSAGQAGFALAAYGVGTVVGVLVGGTLTDRVGPRRTIVASMTVAAALTPALIFLPDFGLIAGCAAVLGVAAQAYRPAAMTLLTELTPDNELVMVFAAYRLAFNLGMTAGPLLGVALIAYSFDLLFLVEAAACLAFVMVAALMLPRDARNHQSNAPDAVPVSPGSYLEVLGDRRYLLFLLALFLNAVVYIQYVSTLPLHIRALGEPVALYGALVALNAFAVICCELPLTRLVQRMPARIAIAVGVGLVGLGLTLYAIPAGVIGLVVATLIWTLGEIIGTPTASAYPARVAPPERRGRYIAAASAPQQIGYALGPVLGTAVWAAWGTGVWWLCGALTVIAVIAAALGVRDPRAKTATAADTRPVDDPLISAGDELKSPSRGDRKLLRTTEASPNAGGVSS
jgi:MFS family permease